MEDDFAIYITKKYKLYVPESYYHVYSRGINKSKIFRDEDDKSVFLNLMKRYLSKTPEVNSRNNRQYPSYFGHIELLSYALMPNHFHLLLYQTDEQDIISFMRSIMTSYSKYFNKKYKHFGPVFQSRYLASLIDSNEYLYHISRYIHLNPSDWKNSTDTSLDFYSGKRHADWISPGKILDLFTSYNSYLKFLEDYDPEEESFVDSSLEQD